MATTRERVLDAALELVGTSGLRALTHGRIDEAAGVPRGSTSNYFRTRAALCAGVVEHLVALEFADFDPSLLARVLDADVLASAMAELIELQATAFRTRTIARFTFFLEATHNPELQRILDRNRALYEEWMRSVLARLGARSAEHTVRSVMATADGLLLHRITVGRDLDLRATMRGAIAAALA